MYLEFVCLGVVVSLIVTLHAEGNETHGGQASPFYFVSQDSWVDIVSGTTIHTVCSSVNGSVVAETATLRSWTVCLSHGFIWWLSKAKELTFGSLSLRIKERCIPFWIGQVRWRRNKGQMSAEVFINIALILPVVLASPW